MPQRGANASGGSRSPPSLAAAAKLAEKEELWCGAVRQKRSRVMMRITGTLLSPGLGA